MVSRSRSALTKNKSWIAKAGSSSGSGTNSDGTTYTFGSTDIPAQELDPVRSTDYRGSGGSGAGATTVSGEKVWSSGDSSSSNDVGSGGTVKSTTFSTDTTRRLTGATVNEKTKVLAPQDSRTSEEAIRRLEPHESSTTSSYNNPVRPNYWKEASQKEKVAGVVQKYGETTYKERRDLYLESQGEGKNNWFGRTFKLLSAGWYGLTAPISDVYYEQGTDIPVVNTKYPVGGTSVYNPNTQEFEQPTVTVGDNLKEEAFTNPDAQSGTIVGAGIGRDVEKDLLPEYQSKVTSDTSEAELEQINKNYREAYIAEFESRANQLQPARNEWAKQVAGANVRTSFVDTVPTSALIASTLNPYTTVAGSTLVASEGFGMVGSGAVTGDWKEYALGGVLLTVGTFGAVKGTTDLITQSRLNAVRNAPISRSYGDRFVKGNMAIDKTSNIRLTKYGMGRTDQIAVNVAKGNTFGSSTLRVESIGVKDIWSGKPLIVTQSSYSSVGGNLLKTQGGITPSFYSGTYSTAQQSWLGGKIIYSSSSSGTIMGAGRTTLKDGYVFSQSGTGGLKVNYDVTRFSGKNYYKDVVFREGSVGFKLQSQDVFKLNQKGMIYSIGNKGSGTQNYGGGQTTILEKSSSSSGIGFVQRPILQQKLIQIPSTSAVSGGLSSGLSSTITSSSLITGAGLIQVGRITGINSSIQSALPSEIVRVAPTTRVVPITGIGTASKISSISSTSTIGRITGSSVGLGGLGFTGFGLIPALFTFPSGGGLTSGSKIGKVKAIAKYKYTPDYASLVKGVRGRETAGGFGGRFSGFEARPVTKGWIKSLGFGGSLFKRRKKKK